MWINQFVDTMTQYYDTPRVLIEGLGYFAVASALGNRVWLDQADPLYPNMYLVIVAPPGRYRKSSVAGKTMTIVKQVLGNDCLIPNRASSEAFARRVDQIDVGVLFSDEFRGFIAHTRKDYAAQMRIAMLELFSQKNTIIIETMKDKEPIIMSPCIMSFLSTSTPESLISSLKDDDAVSGLVSRFLLIESTQKEKEVIWQQHMDSRVIDGLVNSLKSTVNSISGPMTYSESGKRAYEHCYIEIGNYLEKVETTNEDIPNMIARADVYVHKLAIVQAAASGRKEVNEDDVYTVANKIVKPSIRTIGFLLDQGAFQDKIKKIMSRIVKTLKRKNGSMRKRELCRNLNLTASEADEALKTLEYQGVINFVSTAKSSEIHLTAE
jgi:hypothetical protein